MNKWIVLIVSVLSARIGQILIFGFLAPYCDIRRT